MKVVTQFPMTQGSSVDNRDEQKSSRSAAVFSSSGVNMRAPAIDSAILNNDVIGEVISFGNINDAIAVIESESAKEIIVFAERVFCRLSHSVGINDRSLLERHIFSSTALCSHQQNSIERLTSLIGHLANIESFKETVRSMLSSESVTVLDIHTSILLIKDIIQNSDNKDLNKITNDQLKDLIRYSRWSGNDMRSLCVTAKSRLDCLLKELQKYARCF